MSNENERNNRDDGESGDDYVQKEQLLISKLDAVIQMSFGKSWCTSRISVVTVSIATVIDAVAEVIEKAYFIKYLIHLTFTTIMQCNALIYRSTPSNNIGKSE